MRLIAERILERDGLTFLQGELMYQRKPVLPAPRAGNTHHIYCRYRCPYHPSALLMPVVWMVHVGGASPGPC